MALPSAGIFQFGIQYYAVICFLCLVAFILWVLFYRIYGTNNRRQSISSFLPPCYAGAWRIPWLGCALEFGKGPLKFIEKARIKLGPVFTLKVAGQRMTFVTEVEDFVHFFESSFVDFQGAVQETVCKVASVSEDSFQKCHTNIHDTLKGRLSSGHLEEFCSKLSSNFQAHLDKCWGLTGSGDLNLLIRRIMYVSVLDVIMGSKVMPTADEREYKQLEQNFICYDEQFEYGSQLPGIFLRKWSKSKEWLIKLFENVVKISSSTNGSKQSVLQSLIATVDHEHAANYSLLLMWATLANAIPITFWTMALILSHEEVLREIKLEVDKVLGKKKSGDVISMSDLEKLPALKRCVLEAIRLHSPGTIVRKVTKDFPVRSFIIPEGDLLMLSPYWAHRNSSLFPHPETFNPDRWKSIDLGKNVFLNGFVAFGGGRYQCPGRWFAVMEIHLFTAILIHSYDIQLLQPVPKPSALHVVGTQQPSTPLHITYRKRSTSSFPA